MAGQIVRIWGGYGTPAGIDRYRREHFVNSVLPHLRSITGFVEAKVLTRSGRGETELVVATTWDSIESVKAFAGEDYGKPSSSQLFASFSIASTSALRTSHLLSRSPRRRADPGPLGLMLG